MRTQCLLYFGVIGIRSILFLSHISSAISDPESCGILESCRGSIWVVLRSVFLERPLKSIPGYVNALLVDRNRGQALVVWNIGKASSIKDAGRRSFLQVERKDILVSAHIC